MNIDVQTANDYFAVSFNSDFWSELTEDEKQKAVLSAYNFVKTLPFIGKKITPEQEDIFPRIYEGKIIQLPTDVMFGVFEEALTLAKKFKNNLSEIPEGINSLSLGNSSVSFNASHEENLAKTSKKFLDAWLKKGFDIESEKFREVY